MHFASAVKSRFCFETLILKEKFGECHGEVKQFETSLRNSLKKILKKTPKENSYENPEENL